MSSSGRGTAANELYHRTAPMIGLDDGHGRRRSSSTSRELQSTEDASQ